MKAWTQNAENYCRVLSMYRSPEMPTVAEIARTLKTQPQYVYHVLKMHMPQPERKALAALRYSRSKSGTKNRMLGRVGAAHHNWKGECEDGRGYLTTLWNGKREFVHRVVMMKHLGITQLPEGMDVHHIDEDPKNNVIDNLALVTIRGHQQIHFLQRKDSLSVQLKRSTLADAVRYMTSQ